jgi:hypothetical protein
LSTTGKQFEKVILKIVQRHISEKGLLNAGQFGFRAGLSTALQCMRLTGHVTLNFNNNNISTDAVFLDIEKAFDKTWHPGLLHKFSKLDFLASLIKLISSFVIENSLSVECEMSTPRIMKAGVPQGSVVSPTLFNMHINDTPKTTCAHLTFFADDTCLCATERKEGYALRKLQSGLNSMAE